MAPKNRKNNNANEDAAAPTPAATTTTTTNNLNRIVANESLLATTDEREHTSKSLYNDHAARIGSNLGSICDRQRIAAYGAAFQHSTVGKNVLFVGSFGIALLPMICARAGAKSVTCVDDSAILHVSEILAAKNNLTNITFIQASVRDGKAKLPMEKYDVIVCEWMGSFITNDADFMELEYAVKHHLVDGGLILPNRAQLHVVALSDFSYRNEMVDYWDNVYGFQMHSMKHLVQQEASTGHIPRSCIVSKPVPVHALEFAAPTGNAGVDAATTTAAALAENFAADKKKYTAPFKITVDKKCTLHFLTFYLSGSFTDKQKPRGNFILSFSMGDHNPFSEVSLTLPQPIPVFEKDVIEGVLTVNPVRHHHTELELTLKVTNAAVGPEGLELKEKYLFAY